MGFTVHCWQFKLHQSPNSIFLSYFLEFSGDQQQDVRTVTWRERLSTGDLFLSSREWITLSSVIHPSIIMFHRAWDMSTIIFHSINLLLQLEYLSMPLYGFHNSLLKNTESFRSLHFCATTKPMWFMLKLQELLKLFSFGGSSVYWKIVRRVLGDDCY